LQQLCEAAHGRDRGGIIIISRTAGGISMQSCSYEKHMWGLRIPTIYRRAARENVNSFSISHTMKHRLRILQI
jgi:hypothetical protein